MRSWRSWAAKKSRCNPRWNVRKSVHGSGNSARHIAGPAPKWPASNLCHNIYRWERGAVDPSERYRLYYCKVLGIPPAAFGGATETAKTGTLVLPRGFGGEVGKLLNLLDVEHGVSLRAESSTIAVRIARELSEGMTQAGRIATHEFLVEIAQAVRWPQRGY